MTQTDKELEAINKIVVDLEEKVKFLMDMFQTHQKYICQNQARLCELEVKPRLLK